MSTARTRRWSSVAGSRPSLAKMDPTWVSMVLGERCSRWQMAWLERPSAMRARMSRSRVVRLVRALSSPRRRSSCADDLGVDGRSAAGDAPQRVGELGDVGHPVFEQVADALGRVLEQVDRLPGFHVLGQDQHAGAGMFGADPLRGQQPVVGVGGRHPDVGDHHVGFRLLDDSVQGVGVACLADDEEPLFGQDPGQPFAEQHRVVGEHHPDGRRGRRGPGRLVRHRRGSRPGRGSPRRAGFPP